MLTGMMHRRSDSLIPVAVWMDLLRLAWIGHRRSARHRASTNCEVKLERRRQADGFGWVGCLVFLQD